MGKKAEDISGCRFGKLLVIRRCGSDKNRNSLWECLCDCGNVRIVAKRLLTDGRAKSCGCSRFIHGKSNKGYRLYNIWTGMRKRCNHPSYSRYSDYGGRGIQICEDWNSFANFERWALDNGYRDDLTIDRVNVNGDYEPNNCRWATWKQQQNNRRSTHFLTMNNETHSIEQWSKIVNISRSCISWRLHHGWSVNDALTVPSNVANRKGKSNIR